MAELKPAYLVCGDDQVRLDDWRRRLRARSEDESAELEVLKGDQLSSDAVAQAVSALTLAVGRRYVLADGIERWSEKDATAVGEALRSMPPETIAVLIAPGKPPAALTKAVEAIGGEVHNCEAPRPAGYPRWVAERGRELGIGMTPEAIELLLSRVGQDQRRLLRELEKIAIHEGGEGDVSAESVDVLTATAVEAKAWELGDAVVEGDRARAVRLAEDLRSHGEEAMYILFALLRQIRNSHRAWAMTAAGKSAKDVQSALRVPPFVAKRLVAQARRADGERLERAMALLADLDWSIRGAGNLDFDSALTLAVARAATPA